jgi:hypothetical protein
MRNVTVTCEVYGGTDGAVAFLDLPEGVMPPGCIAHLIYLGNVPSVVTMAVNILREQQCAIGAPETQRAIADLLGTRQQYISRWQNGDAAPDLSGQQWARLVQLVIAAAPASG